MTLVFKKNANFLAELKKYFLLLLKNAGLVVANASVVGIGS
jgi:hypothetical protein